jgi:serine/threonine protein kinase
MSYYYGKLLSIQLKKIIINLKKLHQKYHHRPKGIRVSPTPASPVFGSQKMRRRLAALLVTWLLQNHFFCADFYAVGVIAYELLVGKRPYLDRDRKTIRGETLRR